MHSIPPQGVALELWRTRGLVRAALGSVIVRCASTSGMNLPLAATQSVSVQLKSERNGEVLEIAVDPPGVWKRASASVSEESLTVLASVAPYDDTVLDFRSCSDLVREISELRPTALGADAEFFEKVVELAKRVMASHDLFLLFVGD